MTNPGWKKIEEINLARSAAKKARLKKEALYRVMVGSGRELQRRRFDLGLIKRRR